MLLEIIVIWDDLTGYETMGGIPSQSTQAQGSVKLRTEPNEKILSPRCWLTLLYSEQASWRKRLARLLVAMLHCNRDRYGQDACVNRPDAG
ncbi:MAG: hypothetical protein DMG62_22395 [Acidobacteria bacterium]|nr:MAG: hypothetical protein DMG63_08550 [Acidobacteriota bacterium]PYY20713.1 MAG: hypothetical protein DMG62_22395 [Acidobacteriota bacterium]